MGRLEVSGAVRPLYGSLGVKGLMERLSVNAPCYPAGGDRGSTVVKVLCYISEGRWFDPSWCQWIFH